MKRPPILLTVFFLVISTIGATQEQTSSDNKQEFETFLRDFRQDFIYLEEKKDILECIEKQYASALDQINHPYYKVEFYETILNEFYDSHIHLNTNTDQSYRLEAPLYVSEKEGQFYIEAVFSDQLEDQLEDNIIDAQIVSMNKLAFQTVIDSFPTKCHDKTNPEIREWIANKVIAGRRNEPRILLLKLKDGSQTLLNVDQLKVRKDYHDVNMRLRNEVGIIRINNSLGDKQTITAFDMALDSLANSKAIILDLRNTPSGGNTGVAEPIIGRFIKQRMAYQKCENAERRYLRYAPARRRLYDKPLFILVGRWTGSMGEGMAIGFDGMNRAIIIGTEMKRLAGGMKTIPFQNSEFGFRVSFEKMYHLNGNLRESFVPDEYVKQTTTEKDEVLEHALKLIDQLK